MQPCRYVFEEIRFDMDAIFSCCNNVRGLYVTVPHKANVNEVMEDYFKKANKILNGIHVENECEGCYKLTKEFLDEHCNDVVGTKIKTINICNWRHCNLDCIYCVYRYEKNNRSHYDILPYLKWLKDNNKLAYNFKIAFGGGEPGVLKDTDKILRWAKNNIAPNSFISIMSNMIIFKNSYKQLLKEGQLSITCSLDCGDRELYKKIHNFDGLNLAVNNLKKTLKYMKNEDQITLKYIFLENYNDNEKALYDFINLSEKIGIKKLTFNFDRAYYNIGKPIPEKLLYLYNLAKCESLKRNFLLYSDYRADFMCNQKMYI